MLYLYTENEGKSKVDGGSKVQSFSKTGGIHFSDRMHCLVTIVNNYVSYISKLLKGKILNALNVKE
jgi:hypothetical protein